MLKELYFHASVSQLLAVIVSTPFVQGRSPKVPVPIALRNVICPLVSVENTLDTLNPVILYKMLVRAGYESDTSLILPETFIPLLEQVVQHFIESLWAEVIRQHVDLGRDKKTPSAPRAAAASRSPLPSAPAEIGRRQTSRQPPSGRT